MHILLIMERLLLDDVQMCVCFNTRKAARAVTRLYDDALRPVGLRATQLTLLMAIEMMGAPTISALAEQMVMDRTTLAHDLRPLQTAGLVTVAPGDDRRTRITQLTEVGRRALSDALPLWRHAQASLIGAGLGDADWRRLQLELQRLVNLASATSP